MCLTQSCNLIVRWCPCMCIYHAVAQRPMDRVSVERKNNNSWRPWDRVISYWGIKPLKQDGQVLSERWQESPLQGSSWIRIDSLNLSALQLFWPHVVTYLWVWAKQLTNKFLINPSEQAISYHSFSFLLLSSSHRGWIPMRNEDKFPPFSPAERPRHSFTSEPQMGEHSQRWWF